MQGKRKKSKTYRTKDGDYWICIKLHEYEPKMWNIGAVIHKSKRAQNDWYNDYRNKRSRAVELSKQNYSIRQLALLYRLFKKAVNDRKDDEWLVVTSENTDALGWGYIERLGFTAHHLDNELLWILAARSAVEALNLLDYTKQKVWQKRVRELELACVPLIKYSTTLVYPDAQQSSLPADA